MYIHWICRFSNLNEPFRRFLCSEISAFYAVLREYPMHDGRAEKHVLTFVCYIFISPPPR